MKHIAADSAGIQHFCSHFSYGVWCGDGFRFGQSLGLDLGWPVPVCPCYCVKIANLA